MTGRWKTSKDDGRRAQGKSRRKPMKGEAKGGGGKERKRANERKLGRIGGGKLKR